MTEDRTSTIFNSTEGRLQEEETVELIVLLSTGDKPAADLLTRKQGNSVSANLKTGNIKDTRALLRHSDSKLYYFKIKISP